MNANHKIIFPSRLWISVGVLAFLVYFVMLTWGNALFPLHQDDLWLNNVIDVGAEGKLEFMADKSINNVPDLLSAAWKHRALLNGRMSDVACMVSEYMGGHERLRLPFAIMNPLVWIVILTLLQRICWGRCSVAGYLITAGLSVVAFFAAFYRILFWMSAAYNYIWGLLLLLLLLPSLHRSAVANERLSLRMVPTLVLSLLVGGWHEALALPLIAAMVFFFFIRKGKCSPLFIVYGVFLCTGLAFQLSAGGLYTRIDTESENYAMIISQSLEGMVSFLLLPSLLLAILCYYKRATLKIGVLTSSLYTLMGVCYVGFAILLGHYGLWGGAYFYAQAVLLVLILKLLSPSFGGKQLSVFSMRLLTAASSLLAIAYMGWSFRAASTLRGWHEQALQYHNEHPESDIVVVDNVPRRDISQTEWSTFPIASATMRYNYYGPLFGHNKFVVLLNQLGWRKEHYQSFKWTEAFSRSVGITRCGEDGVMIRISMEQCEYTLYSCVVTLEDDSMIKYSLYRKDDFLKRVPNMQYRLAYADYADGYVYVLLPACPEKCKEVRFAFLSKANGWKTSRFTKGFD